MKSTKLATFLHPQEAKKISLIVGDTKGSAAIGITEFKRMVDFEQSSAVLVTRSPVALAINPISLSKKIPIVGVAGHADFVLKNKFAFRSFPSSEHESEILAQYTNKVASKISVITVDDDYAISLTKYFSIKVEKRGSKIVYSDTVLPGSIDFLSIISKIKSSTPDIIFANLNISQLAPFVSKLRLMGVSVPIISNFYFGIPDVFQAGGDSAEGVIFPQVNYNQPKFLELLKTKFNTTNSSPVGFSCFVGMSMIYQALRNSGQDVNSIYQSLLSLSQVELPDGKIQIKNREAELPLAIMQIKNGKPEPV